MTTRRHDILARLPIVFGLSAEEAAAACGVSAGTFLEMVEDHRMPAPRKINSRLVWDVDEVRAAFKALPRAGERRRDPEPVRL
jgi:excisionase family DNA binding protein